MAADEEAVTLVLLDAMVLLRVVVLVALALLRVTPLGSNAVVPKVLPDALTLLRVALALLLPLWFTQSCWLRSSSGRRCECTGSPASSRRPRRRNW